MQSSSGRKAMIRWFIRRQIAAFERAWNYDSSYMRDVLDADPRAVWAFSKVMGLSQYRKDVPLDAYYAAKIAGTMAEDCGPCTQLAVDMAGRAGVAAATLQAIVLGDIGAMPEGVALAVRFTRATLRHDWEADALREEVVRCWGKRGLISLAFAITSARIFPTLKYALGHGRACMRVTVDGKQHRLLQEAGEAA
jgi:hypothetical protein